MTTAAMPIRITGTGTARTPALFSRWLSHWYRSWPNHPDTPVSRWEVTNGVGVSLGLIEYIGIPIRGGSAVRYGWRPEGSGWTASQLQTKTGAAKALARRSRP